VRRLGGAVPFSRVFELLPRCRNCGGLLVRADSGWYTCGEYAGCLYFTYLVCARCGLEMHRDEVPAIWAARRFDELLELAKSHTSFSAQFRMLINPRIPVLA